MWQLHTEYLWPKYWRLACRIEALHNAMKMLIILFFISFRYYKSNVCIHFLTYCFQKCNPLRLINVYCCLLSELSKKKHAGLAQCFEQVTTCLALSLTRGPLPCVFLLVSLALLSCPFFTVYQIKANKNEHHILKKKGRKSI